jgi:nicotinamide phosphoribosyltransferase
MENNKMIQIEPINTIMNVDSYKDSHFNQYPPGTTHVYSYIESRGGAFDKTLFFGLQMFLKQYLSVPITLQDINDAEEDCALHGTPFNRQGWMYILRNHNGYMPVEIRALPEGTVIPTKNVLLTVVNTDPNVPWVTSYVETALLRAIWYPTTVATLSWHSKQIIRSYLEKTCDNPEAELPFKLHDFGARGASSEETAAIGGTAHLVNFMGTDTKSALRYARHFYGERMAGFSIPAMEHSTVTSWGKDNEIGAYKNMLQNYAKPGKILAIVSDSYDLWNCVRNIWGDALKEDVINSGALICIRPDSGDPELVPTETIKILGEKYGFKTNNKGYKVLHPSVRVVQGDGVNIDTIPIIYDNLTQVGWSAENLTLGMGGGLLQKVDRDTLRFAMKASAIKVNGVWQDVYKDPVGDPGKRSKKGRFVVTFGLHDGWQTLPLNSGHDWDDMLQPVWRDGVLLRDQSFQQIREISNLQYY